MPFTQPLAILAFLSLNVFLAEWLAVRRGFRQLGSGLLVIIITAVVANLGLLPSGLDATPVYDGIFSYVAPLAIFFLLLRIDLRDLKKAGVQMIAIFLLGSVGTMLGVWLGLLLIDGKSLFGEYYAAVAGMFVGTYTGGSVNFNAVALHYGVAKEGLLYATTTVVDNIVTTLWMAVTLAVPRWLGEGRAEVASSHTSAHHGATHERSETVDPRALGLLMALALCVLWLSNAAAAWLEEAGLTIPSILILSTLALVLAQIPRVARMQGAHVLGHYAIYLFLAVIGALCDVHSLAKAGRLGLSVFLFTSTILLVHGLVIFGLGRFIRRDWTMIAVGSQANIGGPPTALAVAESLGREDLLLPAILVGALGYGIGTYLGFLTAAIVQM